MTSPDSLDIFRKEPFSKAIEQFEELLIHGDRTFLIGAGCSKCAGLPLTFELTNLILEGEGLDSTSKEILGAIQELFSGAPQSQIEDYLSELVDHLAITERRVDRGVSQVHMPLGGNSYSHEQLRNAAEQIKRNISAAIDINVEIEIHRNFVRAVHQPVRVGKAVSGSVVNYLLLNYDTVVEDALGVECIPFADGIEGGVTGWWNPSTFDNENLAARVLKLHGSVNWREFSGDSLPRRIAPSLKVAGSEEGRILIWPASTKYRETQLDPFAQLADRARQAIRPARGSQRVLIICGYSFSDAHINIEVDRALRESEGDLTVIAFTSDNQPVNTLKEWNEDGDVREQVLIYAKRGFYHGDTVAQADKDLPWWKFENVVRLLGGER